MLSTQTLPRHDIDEQAGASPPRERRAGLARARNGSVLIRNLAWCAVDYRVTAAARTPTRFSWVTPSIAPHKLQGNPRPARPPAMRAVLVWHTRAHIACYVRRADTTPTTAPSCGLAYREPTGSIAACPVTCRGSEACPHGTGRLTGHELYPVKAVARWYDLVHQY
jgi:hypothetical protein